MDYGKRVDHKKAEQRSIYQDIELAEALNRAQKNIFHYSQYCDELIGKEKEIETIPIELMMTAADESVFIMKQYNLLEERYIKLTQTIKETFN